MAKFREVRLDAQSQQPRSFPSTNTLKSATNDSDPTVYLDAYVQALWTDLSNSIYYLNATISGDSETPLVFPLLLDTGSSVLWIYSSTCTEETCEDAPRFNASGVVTTSSFSLSYSGELVNGSLVDALANNITWRMPNGLVLTNYTFGLADVAPLFFANYAVSGIVGIPALDGPLVPSNFIVQAGDGNATWSLRFGLVLGGGSAPDTDPTDEFGGLLLLGDEASENEAVLATEPVHYCPLDNNTNAYWLVTLAGVFADGQSVINSSRQAIVDTGTTGLSLPLADADALHEALFGDSYVLDGSGNYAFLCNATGEIAFEMGGANFTIGVASIRGDKYTSTVLTGYCASKAQGSSDNDMWILGASFLQNFYSIFDLDKFAIGFAPRVESYVVRLPKQVELLTSLVPSLAVLSSSASSMNTTNLTETSSLHSGGSSHSGFAAVAVAALLALMY